MATRKKMDSYLHIGFKEWYKTEAAKWTDEAAKWPSYPWIWQSRMSTWDTWVVKKRQSRNLEFVNPAKVSLDRRYFDPAAT